MSNWDCLITVKAFNSPESFYHHLNQLNNNYPNAGLDTGFYRRQVRSAQQNGTLLNDTDNMTLHFLGFPFHQTESYC